MYYIRKEVNLTMSTPKVTRKSTLFTYKAVPPLTARQKKVVNIAALVGVIALAILITGALSVTAVIALPLVSTVGAAFMMTGGSIVAGISLAVVIYNLRHKKPPLVGKDEQVV
jgi:hypothetical protein